MQWPVELLVATAEGVFVQGILIILTTGLLAGLVCRQWSLPPLMGYIVVGMAIGPSALGLVRSESTDIEHVAELGVFFLLFSIGLELSLDDLKRTSRYMLIGGPIQMTLVAVPVALGLMGLGWPAPKAWLLGAAVSLSSTVLVIKALGEMGRLATGSFRRSIGILLFQDMALIPLLLFLPVLSGWEAGRNEDGLIQALTWVYMALVTVGFVAGTVLLRLTMVYLVVPRIMQHRSPDLVVLMALVVLGSVTLAAYRLGLPAALGAFAAGVVFGGNRWAEQIDSLILPFREVFSAIFFVCLGLLIDPHAIAQDPWRAGFLLAGLVVVKGLAAGVALRVTGLSWRESVGPALGLAHVGEFAFVVILLASTTGVLSQSERQLVIAVAGGSLLAAPLLLRYGFRAGVDSGEETVAVPGLTLKSGSKLRRAVVIGMGPVGRATAGQLETLGFELACLDLNPLNLQGFSQLGVPTVAGNAESDDVLRAAGVVQAQMILICVPQDEVAVRVSEHCRRLNSSARIVVRCRYLHTLSSLRRAGADFVVSEEANAARQLVELISKA
ncbi:MAG: cation:proton antiporter [Pirellulaceae bacterium]|nr:cation:proton antiporter [Pirellulaceae bacterium]